MNVRLLFAGPIFAQASLSRSVGQHLLLCRDTEHNRPAESCSTGICMDHH